jgi:integrator complex subunit 11
MFDFKHIKPFDMTFVDQPGPQVLFASPGMLHAGVAEHTGVINDANKNNYSVIIYVLILFVKVLIYEA